MSKFGNDSTTEDKNEKRRTLHEFLKSIQDYEKKNHAKSPVPSPEIFETILDMSSSENDCVRLFHWLKGVERIKRQENGVAFFCEERVFADGLFQYIGDLLIKHYRTPNMATVRKGRVVRYYRAPDMKEGLPEALKRVLEGVSVYGNS